MKEKLQEIGKLLEELKKNKPEEIQSFLNFMQRAEKDSAISAKNKELINISLAVAAQCQWCIAFHTKNALNLGATKDEILDAGFQAVLMHGGPALMYMIPLLEAIEEFGNES
ncbi:MULTISPECIES: carboxymuconolactone decarboxylase family protein [unclassified Lebetimonas]|uniref:carboxymuconolactone decarboxylase family protein n=1 Tax=unclassified Lebetimonas TaxID=2648158 RepID=UPI0004673354|nr:MULTISPECIES: carboxymuconolactone decarboxylase family protein [unclassified Lebetimonas]